MSATENEGIHRGTSARASLDFACFGYSFPTHMFEPVTPIRPYVRAFRPTNLQELRWTKASPDGDGIVFAIRLANERAQSEGLTISWNDLWASAAHSRRMKSGRPLPEREAVAAGHGQVCPAQALKLTGSPYQSSAWIFGGLVGEPSVALTAVRFWRLHRWNPRYCAAAPTAQYRPRQPPASPADRPVLTVTSCPSAKRSHAVRERWLSYIGCAFVPALYFSLTIQVHAFDCEATEPANRQSIAEVGAGTPAGFLAEETLRRAPTPQFGEHNAGHRTDYPRARISPLARKWLPRRTCGRPLARGSARNPERVTRRARSCSGRHARKAKEGDSA